MKLPEQKRIMREDLKEAPSWVDSLLYPLNAFMQFIYIAMNKNLSFRDNIDCSYRDISFETSATYTPGSATPEDIAILQGEIDVLDIRVDELEEDVANLSGVPIGTILSWTSGTSLPIGYLECLGQAVSRSTYSQLFDIIGTTFGIGDGSTTFNLPNGKGLVLRGEGTQSVNGRTKDGGALGDVQEDQMQKITGTLGTIGASGFSATGVFSDAGAGGVLSNSGEADKKVNFNSSGSPDARTSSTTDGETRVSSLAIIFIIRAQNLETATATESAIDSLNARVTDVEAQLPPPITAITGLGDFIKVGADTRNSDTAYTVSFDTPFVAGSDSDISVVINRQAANVSTVMLAYNITKSGFSIDRDNAIDGDQTINYIAVNGAYL